MMNIKKRDVQEKIEGQKQQQKRRRKKKGKNQQQQQLEQTKKIKRM